MWYNALILSHFDFENIIGTYKNCKYYRIMLAGLFQNGSANTSRKIAFLVLAGSYYHYYQRRYAFINKNILEHKWTYAREQRFKEAVSFIFQWTSLFWVPLLE